MHCLRDGKTIQQSHLQYAKNSSALARKSDSEYIVDLHASLRNQCEWRRLGSWNVPIAEPNEAAIGKRFIETI